MVTPHFDLCTIGSYVYANALVDLICLCGDYVQTAGRCGEGAGQIVLKFHKTSWTPAAKDLIPVFFPAIAGNPTFLSVVVVDLLRSEFRVLSFQRFQ